MAPTPKLAPEALSAERARVRHDLVACHHLAARYGMTDLIYTHISARLPGTEDQFLLAPFGLLFDEVTADGLVTVNLDGDVVDDPTGLGINRAGFVIHSAVHQARPDAACVMHTHTVAGVAVSALEEGLLPYSQHAMRFHQRIGYHAYEGIAVDVDERQRLIEDLGRHNALVLRNHGLLTCGASIGEAFELMYFLEFACRAQLQILASARPIALPDEAAVQRAAELFERAAQRSSPRLWQALLRQHQRVSSSF